VTCISKQFITARRDNTLLNHVGERAPANRLAIRPLKSALSGAHY